MTIHACGVGGLLALAAGCFFLVIDPVLQGRSERDSIAQRTLASETRLASLRESRAAIRRELESGQARLDERGVTLLPTSGRNTRLGELTELAGECGLRLDRLQPGASEPGEMFTQIPITMEGLGAYDEVSGFLHRLVNRFDDVGARAFRLEAVEQDGARVATFVFDLTWYADPADQSGG